MIGLYAICILSVLQGLNVQTGLYAYIYMSESDIKLNKYMFGIIYLVFALFNYLRIYHFVGLDKILNKKYKNRSVIKTIVGIYVFLSLAMLSFIFL